MKHRLELLKPERATDRMGAEDVTYVRQRTVHAERVKMQGRRSNEVGEHFPDYSIEYNIRDAHPVEENWRVRQLGGHLYNIVAIIPNIDRGFNTLVCERVNE
ncbi:head-tail adaptor protein [Porphyromonas cangingivalis]|nr:head-tail adaptor protein [Porphyromonas cangingivalis]